MTAAPAPLRLPDLPSPTALASMTRQQYELPPMPIASDTPKWFQRQIAGYIQQQLAALAALVPGSVVVDASEPRWNLPWNKDQDFFPAWEQFAKKLPDGATVVLAKPGFLVQKTDAPFLSGRHGITVYTPGIPHPDGNTDSVPRLVWGGSSSGDVPTRLLFLESCAYVHLKNLNLDCDGMGACDIGIDCDYSGVSESGKPTHTTGTNCTFENLRIYRRTGSSRFVALRISEVSKDNQEYHSVLHPNLSGGNGASPYWGATIDAGSDTVHFDRDLDYLWPAGSLFRLPNAGAKLVEDKRVRDALVTPIKGMPDKRTIVLEQPAAFAVSNERCLLGESLGVGIQIGDSFNAKKHRIVTEKGSGTINNFARGIRAKNGSLTTDSLSFANNEANYELSRGSEFWLLQGDNTEQSRQHLILTNTGQPVTIAPSRLSNLETKPNDAFIVADAPSASTITYFGGVVDQTPPEGCRFFDVTPSSCTIDLGGVAFTPLTVEQLGIKTFRKYYRVHNCRGIIDEPAPEFSFAGDHGTTASAQHRVYKTNNNRGAVETLQRIGETNDGEHVVRRTVGTNLMGYSTVVLHEHVIGNPDVPDELRDDQVGYCGFIYDRFVFPRYGKAGGVAQNGAPKFVLLQQVVPPIVGPDAGKMGELALHETLGFPASGAAHRYTWLRTDMDLDIQGRVLQGRLLEEPDDAELAIGVGALFLASDRRAFIKVRVDATTVLRIPIGGAPSA